MSDRYDLLTPAQKSKLTRTINKLSESRVSLRAEALYKEFQAKRDEVSPEAEAKIQAIEAEAEAKSEALREQIKAIKTEKCEQESARREQVNAYKPEQGQTRRTAPDEEGKAYRAKEKEVIEAFYAEVLGVNA